MKKLRFQAGQKALILNPLADFVEDLGELPEDVQLSLESGGKFDSVHLFSSQSTNLIQLKTIAVDLIRLDGSLWDSCPKRSSKIESNLSRDAIWTQYVDAGLRPISQISIDETWSAVRFRAVEGAGMLQHKAPIS